MSRLFPTIFLLLLFTVPSFTEQIPVRHTEGDTFGFLALRDTAGKTLAYGELKEVVQQSDGSVVDDLHFVFKDGSSYREITKFTQRGRFHVISDQVSQKGPAFKQQSESFLDTASGNVTVKTNDKGKEKTTTQHVDMPDDVVNGLLMTLTKNLDPSAAETTVSMVAASEKPRVVKLKISPGPEKTFKVGTLTHHAQHYVIKTDIQGVAGVIAPIVGKQPPDIHIWVVKSEAPAFLEFEGPLSQDSPVWRIQGTVPNPESQKNKTAENSSRSPKKSSP
jgi:hypothetical protein